jgi:hypothetical protein
MAGQVINRMQCMKTRTFYLVTAGMMSAKSGDCSLKMARGI